MTSAKTKRRPRLAIDVDGPVAMTIEAWIDWMHRVYKVTVPIEQIAYHNRMGQSPGLKMIDDWFRQTYFQSEGDDGGLGGAFVQFMRIEDVYSRYVDPVPGVHEAIEELKRYVDPVFLTALMKRANDHIPDKLDWLGTQFPRVPIITCPSEIKHWVDTQFMVEDRFDTLSRFREEAEWKGRQFKGFLFKKPWSEEPAGCPSYSWDQIIEEVKSRCLEDS